jgi:hypothetical protein
MLYFISRLRQAFSSKRKVLKTQYWYRSHKLVKLAQIERQMVRIPEPSLTCQVKRVPNEVTPPLFLSSLLSLSLPSLSSLPSSYPRQQN